MVRCVLQLRWKERKQGIKSRTGEVKQVLLATTAAPPHRQPPNLHLLMRLVAWSGLAMSRNGLGPTVPLAQDW
jgi:hypothetical protein